MDNFLINVLVWVLWLLMAIAGVALIFEGFDNDNTAQIVGGIALIAVAVGVRFAVLRRR